MTDKSAPGKSFSNGSTASRNKYYCGENMFSVLGMIKGNVNSNWEDMYPKNRKVPKKRGLHLIKLDNLKEMGPSCILCHTHFAQNWSKTHTTASCPHIGITCEGGVYTCYRRQNMSLIRYHAYCPNMLVTMMNWNNPDCINNENGNCSMCSRAVKLYQEQRDTCTNDPGIQAFFKQVALEKQERSDKESKAKAERERKRKEEEEARAKEAAAKAEAEAKAFQARIDDVKKKIQSYDEKLTRRERDSQRVDEIRAAYCAIRERLLEARRQQKCNRSKMVAALREKLKEEYKVPRCPNREETKLEYITAIATMEGFPLPDSDVPEMPDFALDPRLFPQKAPVGDQKLDQMVGELKLNPVSDDKDEETELELNPVSDDNNKYTWQRVSPKKLDQSLPQRPHRYTKMPDNMAYDLRRVCGLQDLLTFAAKNGLTFYEQFGQCKKPRRVWSVCKTNGRCNGKKAGCHAIHNNTSICFCHLLWVFGYTRRDCERDSCSYTHYFGPNADAVQMEEKSLISITTYVNQMEASAQLTNEKDRFEKAAARKTATTEVVVKSRYSGYVGRGKGMNKQNYTDRIHTASKRVQNQRKVESEVARKLRVKREKEKAKALEKAINLREEAKLHYAAFVESGGEVDNMQPKHWAILRLEKPKRHGDDKLCSLNEEIEARLASGDAMDELKEMIAERDAIVQERIDEDKQHAELLKRTVLSDDAVHKREEQAKRAQEEREREEREREERKNAKKAAKAKRQAKRKTKMSLKELYRLLHTPPPPIQPIPMPPYGDRGVSADES